MYTYHKMLTYVTIISLAITIVIGAISFQYKQNYVYFGVPILIPLVLYSAALIGIKYRNKIRKHL